MLTLIFLVAAVGIPVWLVLQFPMPALFKQVIFALAAIGLLYYTYALLAGTTPHLIGHL